MAATNKRGVFSLEKVLERQDSNNWVKIPEVFRYVNSLGTDAVSGPAYGYWGGGYNNSVSVSRMQRLDYSNDTAALTQKGSISSARYNPVGTGNVSYGYWAGGNHPGPKTSVIDRLDYANDSAATTPKGPLSRTATKMAAVATASYGYFASDGSSTSLIDRLDFTDDTTAATPKGNLSSPSQGFAAGTGNKSYGYIGSFGSQSYIDRIDYSNDTATTAVKGPLSNPQNYVMATGNASYGYWGGGKNGGTKLSTVSRLDYSNDSTTASPKGPLSGVRYFGSATGNTSYGYFSGISYPTIESHIDRIDFSNDTPTATQKGTLYATPSVNSVYGTGSASGQANALGQPATLPTPATRTEIGNASGSDFGYSAGNNKSPSGSPQSSGNTQVDRIEYSNDTASAVVKGPLASARYESTGTGNISYAYIGGGVSGWPTTMTTVDRIDYSSDTSTAVAKGPLSRTRKSLASTSTDSYGYFGGGNLYPSPSSSTYTTIDRIDYSSDTSTATPKGGLGAGRAAIGATGNRSYGYFGGGSVGPQSSNQSKVFRVDYSSDTTTAAEKGTLSRNVHYLFATGNANFGYFVGGYTGSQSTIDRIDYSNDTATAAVKGPLASARSYYGGTGNTESGYAMGGAPGQHSNTQKIDYSNDTATATNKGNLTLNVVNNFGFSPLANDVSPSPGPVTVDKGADGYTQDSFGPAFGYHIGGMIPAGGGTNTSTVERIDFSNDTATATVKGPLSSNRHSCATVGTSSYGYACGGPSPSDTSTVDRVDYANDTAAMTTVGPLNTPSSYNSAVYGNASYGYIKATPSSNSSLSRIEYASDSSTALVKGNLTASVYVISQGAGNNSYGYLAGGFPGPVSINNRIDYSNDTATALAKGNMSVARHALGATGNSSYGYFGGGTPGSKSTVDRLDYSSDTTAMAPKGPLSTGRYAVQASGTPSYGYFGAGNTGDGNDGSTIVDRIDFSNDTATASVKGPLTAVRRYSMGVSSQGNGLTSTPTFIPRIRWVDNVAETPAVSGGPAYGYWLGGYGYTSVVDKMDFSNDTANLVNTANSTWQSQGLAGTSSVTHGYWAGGWVGGETTTGNRIDYSSDTGTLPVKGNLSVARRWHMAVGNASAGYQAGGFPAISSIDKIDYSNDTTASAPGATISVRNGSAGAGNQSYGYFAAGRNPDGDGVMTTVDRLDYSSDTTNTSPKGNVNTAQYYKAGASNSDYGWYTGGSPSPAGTTVVDRIDFSNDTATATPKGNLSVARLAHSATGSRSYGYFGGNDQPGGGTSTERIDYSNDTATATPKGNFSVTWRKGAGGVSAQENANPTPTPAIAAPVQPPFPYPQQLAAPAPGHGYWSGGLNNATPNPATSEINRIDFSNDTATTVLKGNMHTGRASHSAIGNQTHAYTGGGNNPAEASPAYLSSIERMTFANDTATSVDKSTFREAFTQVPSPGQGANGTVSVGNLSYGYWQGANSTYVDRLDYSNDTAQAAAHTNSSIPSSGRASVGNLSYGYYAGGWYSKSTVDRLDYGNDTATMSPKGNLEAPLAQTFGVGNGSYGYIISGRDPSLPTYRTSITRIDFADDTSTSSPKGNLAGTSYKGGGTGNASYGYVIEAQNNSPSFGYYTRIYRIDYSNDTATAPAVSNFSYPGRSMSGFGGRSYGLPN